MINLKQTEVCFKLGEKTMKLLHISDIHFGVKFLNKNEILREKLKEAQYTAFKKVIEYSINNKIDGLLIAGDLFDGEYRPLKAERFLLEEFRKLNDNNVKVFYSLGNHDSNETFKENFLVEFPDNVKIFNKERSESYLLNDTIYIHSSGHQNNIENRNLIKDFPKSKKGYYNVGLVHCSVVGSVNEGDKYLPTTREELENTDYDYWALGHIHKNMRISDKIYYSGSLQGLHSKETDKKGGMLIDFENDYTTIDFIEFGVIDFIDLEIDFNNYSIRSKNELIDLIEEKTKFLIKESIIKIYFKGVTMLYNDLKDEMILKEIEEIILRNKLILDIQINIQEIRKKIDYNEYIKNNNILGYIEKNYSNDKIIEKIMEENKIKKIDKNILERILNRMVGIEDEI